MNTTLPEEIVGWVSDAARRFNVTRSEIVQRALEHYLGHVTEVEAAAEQRGNDSNPPADWQQVKETLTRVNCPYDSCPFGDECPADVCSL